MQQPGLARRFCLRDARQSLAAAQRCFGSAQGSGLAPAGHGDAGHHDAAGGVPLRRLVAPGHPQSGCQLQNPQPVAGMNRLRRHGLRRRLHLRPASNRAGGGRDRRPDRAASRSISSLARCWYRRPARQLPVQGRSCLHAVALRHCLGCRHWRGQQYSNWVLPSDSRRPGGLVQRSMLVPLLLTSRFRKAARRKQHLP